MIVLVLGLCLTGMLVAATLWGYTDWQAQQWDAEREEVREALESVPRWDPEVLMDYEIELLSEPVPTLPIAPSERVVWS